MKYDITVGLEIHVELNTNTKLFCGCKNNTMAAANENCCPICLALPDAPKPSLNRAAIEKMITAGLAMDCKINDLTIFERKHYFYPDLPNGYQVSQLERPICIGGHLVLRSGKKIRLNRIHLEVDAAKLLHDEVAGVTLVDFNRGGNPLMEMVTEPDFSSAAEAVEFLEEVRSRLIFAGVANCRMEEGGMRCDVNISLKPKGAKELGGRVELKNLNSFKMVARAIEYEAKRQADFLDNGKRITQETRKWNDAKGTTSGMRTKEQAVDYRYFPDPVIPPVRITSAEVERIKRAMPPLAARLREMFTVKYSLPAYDAEVLTRDKSVCEFFLESIKLHPEPKKVSNWLMTNILAKAVNGNIQISPKQFTDVMKLEGGRKISRQNALVLFDELWEKPDLNAEAVARKLEIFGGIAAAELTKIIDALFEQNAAALADYKATPDKVINFFMGQTMKKTNGMADSVIAKNYILKRLNDSFFFEA